MRWMLIALLAACGEPTLEVHVTDELGTALAEATVQALCDDRGYGAADYTDEDGFARLVLFFQRVPAGCVVTVSRDGFRTLQAAGVPACPPDETCPAVELALELLP